MSHLRPEDKAPKRTLASCRKGKHKFGDPQRIGAGIVRQVCLRCAAVTIDLTGADDSIGEPVLRAQRKISSLGKADQ
jgi:hypothetical protein